MDYALHALIENMLGLVGAKPEADIKQLKPDIVRFESFSYVASLKAMEMMSHIIEDSVTDMPGVMDFMVSFQYMSRLKNQLGRYAQLASASQKMILLGEIDWQIPAWPRTTVIDTKGDPMQDYWFVVADGAGVGMALLAQQVADKPRRYRGFFTFDRGISHHVATTIRALLEKK